MNNEFVGIDYGRGQYNIDTETGIRYGVTSLCQMAEFVHSDLTPEYEPPQCPQCYYMASDEEETVCPDCENEPELEFCFEATSYSLELDGIRIGIDSDNDVWVLKSPYTMKGVFCSPCAPGAVDLGRQTQTGPRAYCLPDDWFENGKAPYSYEQLDLTQRKNPLLDDEILFSPKPKQKRNLFMDGKHVDGWAAAALSCYDQERAKIEGTIVDHLNTLSQTEVEEFHEALADCFDRLHRSYAVGDGHASLDSLLLLYGTIEAQRVLVEWCKRKVDK